MSNPAMDPPSIALARIMDDVVVEESEADDDALGLVCQSCREYICDVEGGDSIRTLFNTALQHVCYG